MSDSNEINEKSVVISQILGKGCKNNFYEIEMN